MGVCNRPKYEIESRCVLQNVYRKGKCMLTVTVSPKFQVVIPSKVRKSLDIQAGQKVQVFMYENRIEMVLVRPIQEMRGFLKGIDTAIEREPDRV